ncbi:MAG: hypothetical protein AAB674_03130 [Patescibacteria group bacterium]
MKKEKYQMAISKIGAQLQLENIEVNLNDDIEVRLTRVGRRIYRAYWKKYNLRPLPLQKTGGRWVRFQLWDFMNIFGNAIYMSAPATIVSNLIRILKS